MIISIAKFKNGVAGKHYPHASIYCQFYLKSISLISLIATSIDISMFNIKYIILFYMSQLAHLWLGYLLMCISMKKRI